LLNTLILLFKNIYFQSVTEQEIVDLLNILLPILKWRHDNYTAPAAPDSTYKDVILKSIEDNHGVQIVAGALLGYFKSHQYHGGNIDAFFTSLIPSPELAGLIPVSELEAGTGGSYLHYARTSKIIPIPEPVVLAPEPTMSDLEPTTMDPEFAATATVPVPQPLSNSELIKMDHELASMDPKVAAILFGLQDLQLWQAIRSGKATDIPVRIRGHKLAALLERLGHVQSLLYLLHRRGDTKFPFERGAGCNGTFEDIEAFALFPKDPRTKRNAVEVWYVNNKALEMISRKRGDESLENVADEYGFYLSERFGMTTIPQSDIFSKLRHGVVHGCFRATGRRV